MRLLLVVACGTPMAVSSPAGEIGMTTGRILSRCLRQHNSTAIDNNRDTDTEILILAGAAAGFCANFDAPFAGALYAMEVTSRYRPKSIKELYFDKRISYFLLASLASAVVKRKGTLLSVPMLSKHFYSLIPLSIPCFLPFFFLGVVTGVLGYYFDVLFRNPSATAKRTMNFLVPWKWLHPLFSGLMATVSLLSIGKSQGSMQVLITLKQP